MFPNGIDRPRAHDVTPADPIALADRRRVDCFGCGRTFDRHHIDAEGACPICRVTHLRAEQNAADLALANVAQTVSKCLTYASPEDILLAVAQVIDERDAGRAPTRGEVAARLTKAEADVDALFAGDEHGKAA